jgi:hypothetical protein
VDNGQGDAGLKGDKTIKQAGVAEWCMVFLTFGMLVVAGLQIAYLARQTRWIQRTVDEMRKASRPYILLGEIDSSGLPTGPGDFFVRTTAGKPIPFWGASLTNHGASPAVVNRFVAVVQVTKEIPSMLDLSECNESEILRPIAAGASSEAHRFPANMSNWNTAECSPGVLGGDYSWLLYGRVEYESFEGMPYWTEFCYRSAIGTKLIMFTTEGVDRLNRRS